MQPKKTSRKEKEDIYISEMTKLQNRWGNPIDNNWDYIAEWSENELETNIKYTIEQIKFEKFWAGIGVIIKIVVGGFVLFGIVGVLLFGIKYFF